MVDDVMAAAQRIMDSRPRSIIDGKQWVADIMLVTRYVLADHNDPARLSVAAEALKEALQKVVAVANRVDDLGGSTWQCGEIARAALDAAPAGAPGASDAGDVR